MGRLGGPSGVIFGCRRRSPSGEKWPLEIGPGVTVCRRSATPFLESPPYLILLSDPSFRISDPRLLEAERLLSREKR